MDIPCTNMALKRDSLYVYSIEYNIDTKQNTVTYGIVDVKKKELVSNGFITNGTKKKITIPYGIAVNPPRASATVRAALTNVLASFAMRY